MTEDLLIKSDVLAGRDGWLFLWNGAHRQFDHLMGLPVDPQSVHNFVDNLRLRREFCEQRGIRYLHLVSPSKPVIMQEFLPPRLEGRIHSLYATQYRDAVDHAGLSKHCFHPADALCQVQATRHVFQKTDSHMNDYGNAVITRLVLERLGITHDPLAHMREVLVHVVGDLNTMMNISSKVPELSLVPVASDGHSTSNRKSIKGNTGGIFIRHNPWSPSTERLLVLGDSFNLFTMPALSTWFRDVIYVRSATFQPDLVEAIAPDIVLTGNTERYLSHVKADAEGTSALMTLYGQPGYEPHEEFVEALRAQLAYRWYRRDYDSWVRKISPYSHPVLGRAKSNMLAYEPGRFDTFISSGPEPWIQFQDPGLAEGIAYDIEIEMISSVTATAQLFVDTPDRPLSSGAVAQGRHEVTAGKNTLFFPVSASRRGQTLRFSPLNCEGRIHITRFSVTPS